MDDLPLAIDSRKTNLYTPNLYFLGAVTSPLNADMRTPFESLKTCNMTADQTEDWFLLGGRIYLSSCGPPTFTTACGADHHSGAVCCVCHGSRMATSCSLRPGMLLRGRTKPFLCVNGLFCVRLNTFCSRRRRKFNLQASRPPRGCRCACTPKPLLTDVYFFMAHQSPAPLSVHLSLCVCVSVSLSLP